MFFIKIVLVVKLLIYFLIYSVNNSVINLPIIPDSDSESLLQYCSTFLNCTFDNINQMTMTDRLTFLRNIQNHVSTLIPGFKKWEALAGVLEFFIEVQWGEPDTWISLVDSAILEGIERAAAIVLFQENDDFGNPGSNQWANYIEKVKTHNFINKSDHDRIWSTAEQASTNHGIQLAYKRSTSPNYLQNCWFEFSQLFRQILRNEEKWRCEAEAFGFGPAFDWATNVEDDKPTLLGSNSALVQGPLIPYFTIFDVLDILYDVFLDLKSI